MTLTMSVAPTKTKAISDSTRLCEIPNNTVNAPNPATHHNIVRPAFRRIGRYARIIALDAHPVSGQPTTQACVQHFAASAGTPESAPWWLLLMPVRYVAGRVPTVRS